MLETADGGALVDQVGRGQIAQPEELPPLGFVLTAMPVDQIRQQPMWMLLVVRCARLGGHIVQQPFARRLLTGLEIADLDAGRTVLRDRTGDVRTRIDESSPQLLQPVAQRRSRSTVVAVVKLDRVKDRPIDGVQRVGLERELHILPLQRRLAKADVALEAVERLELLDRVALDAGAQRLADDGVQIDEALAAQ